MTDNELNQRIAVECGWKQSEGDKDAVLSWLAICGEDLGEFHGCPNYLRDINACAEFEKTINDDDWLRYNCELLKLTLNERLFAATSATARQRCLAFAKMKGWEV